jgi:hypothetical protein
MKPIVAYYRVSTQASPVREEAIGTMSAPSSATMNGMRCTMSPLMKWTSRESLSSFRDRDRAFAFPGHVERACQLRPELERVRSLACLDFGKFSDSLEPVRLRERSNASRWASSPKHPFMLHIYAAVAHKRTRVDLRAHEGGATGRIGSENGFGQPSAIGSCRTRDGRWKEPRRSVCCKSAAAASRIQKPERAV